MQTLAEKPKSQEPVVREPQAAEGVWDGRAGAGAQRGLQEAINNSPRVQQAAQLQAAINTSPRVQPAPQFLNRTGLPDGLKAGVENLSGYSLDDVRVHYNSARPAHLQAHAYAQGTDIHVAPGQEQHLPHEAWHVVQQKQGRVPATLQRKGEAINDEPALEQEADAMGAAALSVSQPRAAALQPAPLGAGSSTQRKVLQLTTCQIVMDAKHIAQIVVRGRPPRVHGSSMGDHTSAFIIHVEGINIALQGKTLAQAVDYVKVLRDELVSLPGFAYIISEPKTSISTDFNREYASLTTHYTAAAGTFTTNTDISLQHLQQAISAYLNARELIPFSTINVAAKSTGLAGKGRGESTAAATLSTFERNSTAGISDFDLLAAVYNLFDDQAASMVAVETNEATVRALTGGVVFAKDKDATQRLEVIWEQHRQSISNRFPKVYAQISSELSSAKIQTNLRAVKSVTIADLLTQAANKLAMAVRSLTIYLVEYSRLRAEHALRGAKINQAQLKAISGIYQLHKEVLLLLPEIEQLDTQLGNEFIGNIGKLKANLQKNSQDAAKNVAKYDEAKHHELLQGMLTEKAKSATSAEGDTNAVKIIGYLRDFQDGDPVKTLAPTPAESGSAAPKNLGEYTRVKESKGKAAASEVKPSTLTREMSPMSIQIILNPTDNSVVNMLSSGRPPSPFKGTMGAHTTAWVVHLDRVRSAIRNKSIPVATAAMQAVLAEVQHIADARGISTGGDNARKLYASSRAEMQQYAKVDSKNSSVVILQQMINATLAFYNLIPGVSVDKINTTGHGEGTARQTLLRYQLYGQGTREELTKAIATLYDGGTTGAMRDLHGTFIKQAYPEAYDFATTGVSKIAAKAIPSTATIDDDTEDYEESPQLNTTELDELNGRKDDKSWLVATNNCLINAITDGAGRARATGAQVVTIRTRLGVPVGEMLYASERALTIILAELGLADQGAVVFYAGDSETDQSTIVSANPIMVYHNGVNHFTALHTPGVKPTAPKHTAFEPMASGSTAPKRTRTLSRPKNATLEKRRRVTIGETAKAPLDETADEETGDETDDE